MIDRFTDAIRRVLEALLPDFDLFALHPSLVIAATDGSVDVRPDNRKLPELVDVPVRGFVPGQSLIVQVNSRVLVGFEGGNRSAPMALLWGAGAFDSLELAAIQRLGLHAPVVTLGGSTGLAVARVSDEILGYIPVGTVLTPAFVPNPVPIPVTGRITTGSQKVSSE